VGEEHWLGGPALAWLEGSPGLSSVNQPDPNPGKSESVICHLSTWDPESLCPSPGRVIFQH
jgi:hypothetical protein